MQDTPSVAATEVAATAEIVPGTGYVGTSIAMSLFQDACLETMPTFKFENTELAKSMFRQNPKTGTYYHQNLDLSVKVQKVGAGKACSMVFSSKEEPSQLAIGMSLLPATVSGSSNPTIDFTSDNSTSVQLARGAKFTFVTTGRNNGRNYYRAAVIVPR